MDDNDTSDDDERSQASIEDEQAADERCAKLITVLQRKRAFSNRTRNKTDELVQSFLQHLEDDIYDMLIGSEYNVNVFTGLDSSQHTENEIETAIRLFPNVLSRNIEPSPQPVWDEEKGEWDWVEAVRDELYPIHVLSYFTTSTNAYAYYQCNYQGAPFIMLFVRLAIEFGQFTEELRGGLLCKDAQGENVLERLMSSSNRFYGQNRLVDETFLEVLIQLRRMGLLKKEDIRRYGLLNRLCHQDYFAENRSRFLVEWDPTALREANISKCLPLHICNEHNTAKKTAFERFRLVFEYGIRYYPKKIGISLLFKIDSFGRTPFQVACSNAAIGYKDTMRTIEDTLRDNTAGPYNVDDALITAAIDENVHLDCVYLLLRREPDVLVKLLSTSTASLTLVDSPINDSNSNSNSNSNRNSKKRKSKGKRKRGS